MANKQKAWAIFNARSFKFQVNNKEKSRIILRVLNKIYPKVPIPLNYKNTFTLLVSVLLSAQCTDVNAVSYTHLRAHETDS